MTYISAQPYGFNGWFPLISPTGLHVLSGYGRVSVTINAFFGQRPVVADLGVGFRAGWWDPVTVAYTVETGSDRRRLVLYNVQTRQFVDPPPHDEALVAGNWVAVSDGHWASVGYGRVAYDNQIIDYGTFVGGELLGTQLFTTRDFGGDRWGLQEYVGGKRGRAIQPDVPIPSVSLTEDGIGIGYWGRAYAVVNEEDGSVVRTRFEQDVTTPLEWSPEAFALDVTATPWMQETAPVLRVMDGEVYVWTCSIRPADGQPFAFGRRLGQYKGVMVTGVPAAGSSADQGFDVRAVDGYWCLAGNDTRGGLVLERVMPWEGDELQPSMTAFPRAVWFGHFFQWSNRYGDDASYPANTTVIVEPGVVDRVPLSPVIMMADQMTEPGVFKVNGVMLREAARLPKNRLLGLYLSAEMASRDVQRLASEIRAYWEDTLKQPRASLLWYIAPPTGAFEAPADVDVFGPEFYFPPDASLMQLQDLLWRKVGWWLDRLGTDRPWMPILQAFDRNFAVSQERMTDIAALQPQMMRIFAEVDPRLRVLPPVLGFLTFAVRRPGGASGYPRLRAWHTAMLGAIPGGPPPVWPTKVLPTPVTKDIKATISAPATWPQMTDANGTLRCVALVTQGAVKTFEWLYRKVGTGTVWVRAALNPGDDLDHTFRFTERGAYEIALRTTGTNGSQDFTMTPRRVTWA